MRLVRSVCTNLMFPDSRGDLDAFRRMAEFLAWRGIASIEFYHDGQHRGEIGRALEEFGLEGIYIAVVPSKEKMLYLCDPDDDKRRQAVAMFKSCLDDAAENGIGQVMVNSGRSSRDIDKGLDALEQSLTALFEHIDRHNYPMRLLMEPCDSHMEAFHLIGPYARAVAFAARMRRHGFPFALTLDSAHTAEEGEDFLEAVKAAKPYCRHIHFANCRITDPADPLYGDKHLGFEFADTVWSPAALAVLFAELEKVYRGDDELRIGIEVLCREDDPYAYFGKTWDSLPFLYGEALMNQEARNKK